MSLTQSIVQVFAEVTALLGDKNIEKEQGSQYETEMFSFLMLMFDAAIFC